MHVRVEGPVFGVATLGFLFRGFGFYCFFNGGIHYESHTSEHTFRFTVPFLAFSYPFSKFDSLFRIQFKQLHLTHGLHYLGSALILLCVVLSNSI